MIDVINMLHNRIVVFFFHYLFPHLTTILSVNIRSLLAYTDSIHQLNAGFYLLCSVFFVSFFMLIFFPLCLLIDLDFHWNMDFSIRTCHVDFISTSLQQSHIMLFLKFYISDFVWLWLSNVIFWYFILSMNHHSALYFGEVEYTHPWKFLSPLMSVALEAL